MRAKAKLAFDSSAEAELFNYSAEAELFSADGRRFGRRRIGYQRFDRASDAIRFAIERLPPEQLVGAYLEVNESRFGSREIRSLYDSARYPLARRAEA
jgi:hypothetical protein